MNLEDLNFLTELKILNFSFFESNLRSTSPMPLVPRPFLKISFPFFFCFWKIWKSWIFSWNWKFWLIFFFFEKFRNLEFFQGIENFEFFFFFWKKPKKYEPNAPTPKALFENFLLLFFLFERFRKNWFFFFFWKFWKSWIFSKNWKFWLILFIFGKQPKKYKPNAPSPNALFENLLFFFFFFEIWRFVHYQKVKKMKMKME